MGLESKTESSVSHGYFISDKALAARKLAKLRMRNNAPEQSIANLATLAAAAILKLGIQHFHQILVLFQKLLHLCTSKL